MMNSMTAPDTVITAVQSGDLTAVRLLLDQIPALIGAKTKQGLSLVLLSMYYQHPEIADLLIDRGATLDIFEACSTGREQRVRELLEADANLLAQFSPDGFTPLGLASFFGHREIVRLLIDRGAGVNVSSTNALKVAPIHSAAARRDVVIVEMLLVSGADPNARQQAGATPLHTAAFEGDRLIAEQLLEHGADPNVQMDNGKTPEDMARERGHLELADLLEEERRMQPNV
jgi:ankyrin repeat protein